MRIAHHASRLYTQAMGIKNTILMVDPPSPTSGVIWNLIRLVSLLANGFLWTAAVVMVAYVATTTIDSGTVHVGSVGASFAAYVIMGLLVSLIASASTLVLWLTNKREAVRGLAHLLLFRAIGVFILAAVVSSIIVQMRL